MAVDVRPYHEDDLAEIMSNLRPVFAEEIKGRTLRIPHHAHVLTIRKEGVILAIVGGHPASIGVLQTWALISNSAAKAPLSFTRSLRLVLGEFLKEKYHRVQMSVRDGCPDELRWAKLLGFKQEGLMSKYGPDQKDYWMLGRVA